MYAKKTQKYIPRVLPNFEIFQDAFLGLNRLFIYSSQDSWLKWRYLSIRIILFSKQQICSLVFLVRGVTVDFGWIFSSVDTDVREPSTVLVVIVKNVKTFLIKHEHVRATKNSFTGICDVLFTITVRTAIETNEISWI